MSRIKHADVVKRFEYIASLCNRRVAHNDRDLETWRLDHEPKVGYMIVQIEHEGTYSFPFGYRHRTATEFWDWSFALVEGMHLGAMTGMADLVERQRGYYDRALS